MTIQNHFGLNQGMVRGSLLKINLAYWDCFSCLEASSCQIINVALCIIYIYYKSSFKVELGVNLETLSRFIMHVKKSRIMALNYKYITILL